MPTSTFNAPWAGSVGNMPSTSGTPNFYTLAQQQAQAGSDAVNSQTQANRPTQQTPWGTTMWNGNTQTQTLNPMLQSTLTQQQANNNSIAQTAGNAAGQVGQSMSQPMDWSQFMPGGQAVQGGNYYNQAAIDAMNSQYHLQNDPLQAQATASQEQTLRNRGVNPGDAGYDQQLQLLRDSQNKSNEDASYQAILNGGAEGARMQGMDINAGNYATSQRNDQINEALLQRNQPLNDYTALTGAEGGAVQPPTMPAFDQAGLAPTPNLVGAGENQFDANVINQKTKAGQTQSLLNAIPGVIDAYKNITDPGSAPDSSGGGSVGTGPAGYIGTATKLANKLLGGSPAASAINPVDVSSTVAQYGNAGQAAIDAVSGVGAPAAADAIGTGIADMSAYTGGALADAATQAGAGVDAALGGTTAAADTAATGAAAAPAASSGLAAFSSIALPIAMMAYIGLNLFKGVPPANIPNPRGGPPINVGQPGYNEVANYYKAVAAYQQSLQGSTDMAGNSSPDMPDATDESAQNSPAYQALLSARDSLPPAG